MHGGGGYENVTVPSLSTKSGNNEHMVSMLDRPIASGLRLWMVLALILGILLMMMIIICCFIKIRIPRTKREIEMDAAMRRKKKLCNAAEIHNIQTRRTHCSTKVIVMSSLPPANQSLLSDASGGMEGDFEDAPPPTEA